MKINLTKIAFSVVFFIAQFKALSCGLGIKKIFLDNKCVLNSASATSASLMTGILAALISKAGGCNANLARVFISASAGSAFAIALHACIKKHLEKTAESDQDSLA